MTIRRPSDEYVPTGAAVSVPVIRDTFVPSTRTAADPDAPVDEAEAKAIEERRQRAEDDRQRNTVAGLQEIMSADDFLPNELSKLHLPTYKFKLFMTDERDLFTRAGIGSLQNLYAALDQMPQAILAESGATAGFNISSVTMEEMVSPGFQNRNTGLTTMKIAINEPNGSSFIETIARSAQKLGISNYQNFWYFLELTFQGYTEDGEIVNNALGEANLPSGGRWIYQINITNCEVKMNEMGSSYDLTCRPMTLNAFEDTMVGAVPDNINVSGATIGEFMKNFADELTKKYDERYAGRIFNFAFKNRPLEGSNANIDPNSFRLQQTENDPINTLSLSQATSGNGVTAQIPMGTRISDVIDFIWVSCEDAQKVMLDTSSPEKVQDGDKKPTFNGKPYRESVVPKVEADVKVTGYDPITNCYMQDITYNIYGYYTYAPNLCPSQALNAADENQNVGGKIATKLKEKGYLRKKYDYRYTGLNTEVIRFDLDFNFAFASVLPRLTGWRADLASVTDAERRAKESGEIQGTEPTEISANGQQNTEGGRPRDAIQPDPNVSNEQVAANINSNLSLTNDSIEELERKLKQEKEGANDPERVAAIERAIKAARDARDSLRGDAEAQRKAHAESQAKKAIEVAKIGTFFSEDESNTVPEAAYKIRYRQAGDERASQAGGSGVLGHWHRGGSLTGALLNQLYQPTVTSLVRIDLEIRGDPYWLGLSNMERRAVLNDIVKPEEMYSKLPNFSEGDNTFALTLRFPSNIDPDTGSLVFRTDDVFNGLYRVNRVQHTFSDGNYTQKLSAMKLDLAMLPASKITEDDLVIEEK